MLYKHFLFGLLCLGQLFSVAKIIITDRQQHLPLPEEGKEIYQCEYCETTFEDVIPPTGRHTYADSVTKEPTCVTPGIMTHTCKVCGDTYTDEIAATGKHDYQKEEILKQANCTQVGQKKLTCLYCSDFIIENIPAEGHSFTTWSVYKPATTTEPGEERCYCDHGCGEFQTREIPMLPPEEPVPDDGTESTDGTNSVRLRNKRSRK